MRTSDAAPWPFNDHQRVKAEDLQIGDVHPSYGACDMIEGPRDGMWHIGWESHYSGWVSADALFTVTEGTDDEQAGA